MKRILAAVLSLILLISLSACQPSPEKAAVVQKDSDRLIEDAQKDVKANTDKNLSEQYGISESYTFDMQGADGKLNIHVDARVSVPEGNNMPIYRVKAAEFTQETVDAFFQALCGDTEMFISSGQRSKDQIRDQIVNIKKRIADIENDPQLSGELETMKQGLAEAEKALETAPDTVVEERADGKLREIFDASTDTDTSIAAEQGVEGAPRKTLDASANTSYTGIDTYEKDDKGVDGRGRVFQVKNDLNPTILYLDYRNPAAVVNFGSSSSFPILEDADVDAEILSKIGSKPSEAKQKVQELLDKTSSGMVVDSIYLQDDEQLGNYDDVTRPAEQYAYKVYCVRAVDGIPGSYVTGASRPNDNDLMAPFWTYEGLGFMINSEGIISMIWNNPIEVIETVNEDAQLKPFSEIQEIFEKMMRVKYEPQAEHDELDFEINRVTLSLHRIIEQNSNDTGLLVPAWNFYGKLIVNESGEEHEKIEQLGESYITINAIDGSIIDTSKGY